MLLSLRSLSAVALILLLAACGNKSDDSSGGSGNATPAAPVATPIPTLAPTATPTPSILPTSTLGVLKVTEQEIPNFHQVTPSLFRSGQPSAAAWAKLKSAGLNSVVSLTSESVFASSQNAEKTQVAAAGLKYFNVPMGVVGAPTIAEINQALQLMVAPENLPVLVHCTFGEDRTGIVIAAYHIKYEQWTVDRAKQDMYAFGHNKYLYWWWDSVLDQVK